MHLDTASHLCVPSRKEVIEYIAQDFYDFPMKLQALL